MKKTKKALASLAIAGMSLSMIPFNVFAASTVPTRLAGVTAEQTAVQIAEQTGYTGAAILASSTSYGMVDALTAGPLAASLKAPILLTGAGNAIDAATKAELTKLAVKTVYVTSGTAVIKQGVIDELKAMGIEVVALGGIDRAETSVNIAKKMTGVTKVAVANTVVDALSIAAVASAANQPILLTDRDALPASVSAYLAANAGITASDVIGGTGVISDAVKAGLPGATRHAGMSAYDTNNQVIQDFAAAIQFDNVYVANGVTGIDALAGAPLAAQTKSPIVLTDGKTVPAVAQFTYSKAPVGAVVTALGGEFVVPETVRDGVAKGQVTPDSNVLQIVSVSALDDTNKFLEITFSKAVSGLQTSDITVKNADTMARYGIREVQMSSNGLVATVELYSQDDDDKVLEYQQDYVVTVNANGTLLTTTFNRPYSFKARVQEINVGDKEIVAYVDKGDNAGGKLTLDVPDTLKFDYQAAMGELIQVWYNEDNELVNYKILSTNSVTDAIEVTADDEIKLLTEDEKYDISTEEYGNSSKEKFAFYLDGEKADIADHVDEKFNFAKVGFDASGDIEFVSAYNLNTFLITDSVDEDEIIGIDGNGTGGSFDAEDATIVKDGKVISIDDVKAGDILFFSNTADDDDGFAEVYNETVSGEIETAYEEAVKVDGEVYDFDYEADIPTDFDIDYAGAVYVDEDGETADVDADAADELQAAGDVTLFFDRGSNLVYIGGDTAATDSNSVSALLTEDIVGDTSYTKDKVQIEALLADESEEVYDMDLEDLDTITIDGFDYDLDTDPSANDEFVAKLLDTQSTIGLFDTKAHAAATSVSTGSPAGLITAIDLTATEGQLVKLHLSDDGDLEEIEFFTNHNNSTATPIPTDGASVYLEQGYSIIDQTSGGAGVGSVLEADSAYARTQYGSKTLSDKVVVFDATDDKTGFDPDDMVVTTWGEYEGSDIDKANVVYNDDNEVVAITILNTTTDDVSNLEAVITEVNKNTDGEVTEITAYVGGQLKDFEVDEVDKDLDEGDVAILVVEDSNPDFVKNFFAGESDIETKFSGQYVIEDVTVADNGVDVGAGKVTAGGVTYTLADQGLVLDGQDELDITKEGLSDLRNTEVTVVLDEVDSRFAKFFIITDELDVVETPDVTDASVDVPSIVQPGDDIELTVPTGNDDLYVVRITNEDGAATDVKNYSSVADLAISSADLAADINAASGDLLSIELRQGTTVISTESALFDNVAPTVTAKLAAPAVLIANATHTLKFSEALSSGSQTAVKVAVDAEYAANGTASVSSAWNGAGTTLTVTIVATDATNNVTVTAIADIAVTDENGNTSAALEIQQ